VRFAQVPLRAKEGAIEDAKKACMASRDDSRHQQTVQECKALPPPVSFDDYYRWGFALLKLNELNEATRVISCALSEHPDEADREELMLYLAEALTRLGEHQRAVEILQTAITVAPHFPEAYSVMGDALRSLGRHEESDHAYRTALRQALPGEEAAVRATAGLESLAAKPSTKKKPSPL